jgi:hypothetical protein
MGDEEARTRREKPGKADDAHGLGQKGTAGLDPNIDSGFARWPWRRGQLQKTQVWQYWSQLCDQNFR